MFNFMTDHNMSAARQIAALRSAVRRSVEGYVVDGVRGLLLAPPHDRDSEVTARERRRKTK